jgi:putative tryptophan/tyrosine transport system substrate-binding protein
VAVERRRFVSLGVSAAAAWPSLVRAQQPRPVPTVGFLSGRWPTEAAGVLAAFHRGLREAGYEEGRNVSVHYRWAEGRYDRLRQLAVELVALNVGVIAATGGGVSGLAAKQATQAIPVVFVSGGDAVKIGLVASLNKPGANVTGVNLTFGALGAKRLELLRELAPAAKQVAVLLNPEYPSAAEEAADLKRAARELGIEVDLLNASTESAFEPAFAAAAARGSGGLLIADDPFLQGHRETLVRLAARQMLPAIYFSRDFTDVGGLASYGPNITDAYRLAGVYTGQILSGAHPGDLPVLQPTKFDLVINAATARRLGLELPPSLLARADEVIE